MNVLVVGGTGFVGERLCTELLDRGHEVAVLARHPEDGDLPDGVERVAGDVTDYDSIESAFEGRDAVYFLPALSPLFQPRGGNEMHFRVHRDGTANAVRAAEEHDVDRYVQMSALGADPDGPTAYIRSKGEAETIVRESDLSWTIFRPSVVFGEGGEFVSFTLKLTPPVVAPLPGGGKSRFQPIWIGDLTPMLADAIEDDEHVGATYEIGGPEVLTLADVAKAGREARGQSVTIVPIPMPLAGLGLTIAGAIPGFPMGADQYRSLQFDNTVRENEVSAFGVSESELTTLAEYLEID
ncbi:complex I NDUFA9 subunit family protein [Haloarculaceae archaeon H-GB1-1]|nr:complex I NDUFA9 subunit family protein [Haloarculaceae archaeon H-GB1-1]